MSSSFGSEFNFQKIIAWGIVIAAGSVALVATFISIANSAKGTKAMDEEAVMARIAPVASVKLAEPKAEGGGARSGEQIYNTVCTGCHAAGVAGAPKTGDKAAWAPRIKLGIDGLLKSAIAGKNAMPPKGGSDANDDELKSAIMFMANQSGASFK